jgi:capsular exopolysaccharide synthesis family protein
MTSKLPLMSDTDLGYGQLFAVLWRRRWWVVGSLLLGLAMGGVVGLRQPSRYISSMQLLLEPNYRGKDTTNKTTEFADTQVEVDTATVMTLMRSSQLIQRAMVKLEDEYSNMDPDSLEDIEDFKRRLTINQIVSKENDKVSSQTKIFEITYSDSSPTKSQRVLQAMEQVYKDYNLEKQKERLSKGLAFVKRQIPQATNDVYSAEQRLQEFRQQQGVIDPQQQATALEAQLNQLIQEQQAVRTQLQDLQNRVIDLQKRIGLSPRQAVWASRLAQSSRYQALLNEIQKTELQLAQQQLRFKSGTPEIEVVLDQRQKQLGLLQLELDRVLGVEAGGTRESLLKTGQLGQLDLSLINQMVSTQVELKGAIARYQNLRTEEADLRSELQRFPQLLATYNRLQPEIELNRESLQQLLQAQQDIGLEIARGGYDWQVVEPPLLQSRTKSGLIRNLLLGGVVGLFVGGGLAFAREAIDDAVHNSEELKKQSALPLVGIIPQLEFYQSNRSLPFTKSQNVSPNIQDILQWQPFREAMDLLYQNLQLLDSNRVLKSIVITSALIGEGKSTLALGLAISAARLHKRVLLIDGDLRNSSLHRLLNLPNDRGLSSLLADDAPLPELGTFHHERTQNNISVLTAGSLPRDPAQLLSSSRMQQMMSNFEQSYDLVIVDGPPVLGMVDAILEGSCCSGTLLVGRLDHVTKSELSQAINSLNQLKLIGVVANGDQGMMLSSYSYAS